MNYLDVQAQFRGGVDALESETSSRITILNQPIELSMTCSGGCATHVVVVMAQDVDELERDEARELWRFERW